MWLHFHCTNSNIIVYLCFVHRYGISDDNKFPPEESKYFVTNRRLQNLSEDAVVHSGGQLSDAVLVFLSFTGFVLIKEVVILVMVVLIRGCQGYKASWRRMCFLVVSLNSYMCPCGAALHISSQTWRSSSWQ